MTVHEQQGSYRRGVVLGLTLAEVFILLVFCLLLLFALSWKSILPLGGTKQRQEAIEKIVADLDRERGNRSIGEFWDEVKLGYERHKLATKKGGEDSIHQTIIAELNVLRRGQPLDDFWRKFTTRAQNAEKLSKALEKLQSQNERTEKELAATKHELSRVKEQLEQALAELAKAREREQKSAGAKRDGHTWPPIILLKEAEGYRFRTGDASLTTAFQAKLGTDVARVILANAELYNVDVIEIVGHTDEQPVQGRTSNLDQTLIPYLRGRGGNVLRAADNAGLGMARAAAVARYLSGLQQLKSYRILPLSSAQVVDSSGRLADGSNRGDVPERRRIEIRLRRSNSGDATVVDGDTIRLKSDRIRLFGIDAPESGDDCRRADGSAWPCGRAATNALRDLVRGKPVTCEKVDTDRYGRAVSICRIDGVDLSCELAKQGFAVDWPIYSKGRYSKCELEAKQAKRGIWSGPACQPFMVKRKHHNC